MANAVPAALTHRGHPYLPDFWDYYTRLPDVYDRFALSTDGGVHELHSRLDLTGKTVLDVASGTGRSAFAIARRAAAVTGVDPDRVMRAFSLRRLEASQVRNVQFLAGSATDLPGHLGTFDLITGFHGPPFFLRGNDAENRRELAGLLLALARRLRPGGAIAFVMATPGWRHPYLELAPPGTDYPAYDPERRLEAALLDEGFLPSDTLLTIDYGSLEEALATYGFIYGPYAIDWLLARNQSTVYFGNRIYLRRY
jgi:SAM-dependent methyltransferase